MTRCARRLSQAQSSAFGDRRVGTYVPQGAIELRCGSWPECKAGLYNYSDSWAFQQAYVTDPPRHFSPQELLGYAFRRHRCRMGCPPICSTTQAARVHRLEMFFGASHVLSIHEYPLIIASWLQRRGGGDDTPNDLLDGLKEFPKQQAYDSAGIELAQPGDILRGRCGQ